MTDFPPPTDVLSAKLNLDTGRITWAELQRHFARGVVLKAGPGLDLVEAATAIAEDDSARVQDWMAQSSLARAQDADALDWQARQPVFWAVVVAPWVLVQEIRQ